MRSLRNQVVLLGNLDKPADITTFETGSMVARFSLAIEPEHATDPAKHPVLWYRMFAWGNAAEFIQRYCSQGNRLAVTGRLVNRTYISPGGKPLKVTEVEVRHVVKF